MSALLRKREKLLIVDNGDDKISSKLYLKGFLERVKENRYWYSRAIKRKWNRKKYRPFARSMWKRKNKRDI